MVKVYQRSSHRPRSWELEVLSRASLVIEHHFLVDHTHFSSIVYLKLHGLIPTGAWSIAISGGILTSHQKKAKCGNQFQHTQCAVVGLWMAMAISLNKSGHMIPYFLNGYSSYSSPMVTLFVGQMFAVGTVVFGKPWQAPNYLNGKKTSKYQIKILQPAFFPSPPDSLNRPIFLSWKIVPCFAAKTDLPSARCPTWNVPPRRWLWWPEKRPPHSNEIPMFVISQDDPMMVGITNVKLGITQH